MQDNRYYGEFGGQYVSESLMNTLNELEKAFDEAIKLCRENKREVWC